MPASDLPVRWTRKVPVQEGFYPAILNKREGAHRTDRRVVMVMEPRMDGEPGLRVTHVSGPDYHSSFQGDAYRLKDLFTKWSDRPLEFPV